MRYKREEGIVNRPGKFIIMIFLLATYSINAQTRDDLSREIFFLKSCVQITDTQVCRMLKTGFNNSKTISTDSVVHLLQSSIDQSIYLTYPPRLVDRLIVLGKLYFNKGDYNNAEKSFRRALIYNQKYNGSITNECRALNNLGNTLQYKGNYKESISFYFQAVQLAEQAKDTMLADALVRYYNNKGTAYMPLKEYQKALYYFNKAESLANKIGHPIRFASIYNNKATAYEKAGMRAQALHCSQQALALGKKFNDKIGQFRALHGLAEIMLNDNKPAQAIPYLQNALALQGNITIYDIIGVEYLLGRAHVMLNNYKDAEEYLSRALANAQQCGVPEYIYKVHKQFAYLYSYTRNYILAFDHLHKSTLLSDSLLDKDKTEAIYALDIKYHTAQKDKDIAEKQLLITAQEHRLEKKNILIISIAVGALILIILLIGGYRTYQHKLKLQVQQQEINQLRASIQGEEKERARIARELHDGIAGMVSAVKMNLITVQSDHQLLMHNKSFCIATNLLDETAKEIRQTAHNLTPEILAQHELQDAITIFCEQIEKSSGVNIKFLYYGTFDHLEDSFKLSIYRMVQELINNIVKHARATDAIVQLSCYGYIFSITVEDNGNGFMTDNHNTGLGIQNIQSRVKSLNGRISIESSEESGTTIYMEFNLPTTSEVFI